MKYDIVYHQGTRSIDINEDAYLITQNIIGVFDGASSLVPYLSKEGETGGYRASRIVQKYLANRTGSPKEGVVEANKKLHQQMKKENINTTQVDNLWSTAAALVQIQGKTLNRASVSDCIILTIMSDGSHKIINKHHDHDKEMLSLIHQHKKEGKDVAFDRSPMLEKSQELRRQANISFGSINGQRQVINHIQSGQIGLEDIKHILLFSDGLFIPKEDLNEEEDFGLLADIFLKEGMTGVLKQVRQIESSDPDCLQFPRYKKHDDATGVAITL